MNSLSYAKGAVRIADSVGVRKGAESQYQLLRDYIALHAALSAVVNLVDETGICTGERGTPADKIWRAARKAL